MATATARRRLTLTPGALLNLDDARGTTIRIGRGRVWVTQHGDVADHVLEAGDTWAIERNGRTLVEAQGDALVDLSGPGAAAAFMPLASTAKPAQVDEWMTRVAGDDPPGAAPRRSRRAVALALRGEWLKRIADQWLERRWAPYY